VRQTGFARVFVGVGKLALDGVGVELSGIVGSRPEGGPESMTLARQEVAKPKCPKCGSERVTGAFTGFYAKTSKKS